MTRLVQATLESWFYSDDESVSKKHVPGDSDNCYQVIFLALKIWKLMCDVNSSFKMTHDGYIKGYSLSNHDLSDYFDALIIDEGQDSNPCIKSIIKSQKKMQMYLVQDHFQQLYRYRGAINLAKESDFSKKYDEFYLTESFRFHQGIADYGNRFLKQLGCNKELKGNCEFISNAILKDVNEVDPNLETAVLSRKVIGTLENALDYHSENKKICWIGGVNNYPFDDIFDVINLKNGNLDKIKNKEVSKTFSSYGQYKSAAKKSNDSDMKRIVSILNRHGDDLEKKLFEIKQCAVTKKEKADIIIGTAHRSKGLEFDLVILSDDFPNASNISGMSEDDRFDELRLLYVASTRAKRYLVTNETVDEVSNLVSTAYVA